MHSHINTGAEFFFFGVAGDPGWDINDAELPHIVRYDDFDEWSSGHRKLVYRPDDEEAKRHSSGWAMRNTNNHNVAILKKSCLGVLVCNCDCTGPHGEKVHIRPAICDKARRKQLSKNCSTLGCPGRLVVMPCRGHCGYPVTHFWRHTPQGVYFQAKGHHDHPEPESKALAEARRSLTNHQAKRRLVASGSANDGDDDNKDLNTTTTTAELYATTKAEKLFLYEHDSVASNEANRRTRGTKRVRFSSHKQAEIDDEVGMKQPKVLVNTVAAFSQQQQQHLLIEPIQCGPPHTNNNNFLNGGFEHYNTAAANITPLHPLFYSTQEALQQQSQLLLAADSEQQQQQQQLSFSSSNQQQHEQPAQLLLPQQQHRFIQPVNEICQTDEQQQQHLLCEHPELFTASTSLQPAVWYLHTSSLPSALGGAVFQNPNPLQEDASSTALYVPLYAEQQPTTSQFSAAGGAGASSTSSILLDEAAYYNSFAAHLAPDLPTLFPDQQHRMSAATRTGEAAAQILMPNFINRHDSYNPAAPNWQAALPFALSQAISAPSGKEQRSTGAELNGKLGGIKSFFNCPVSTAASQLPVVSGLGKDACIQHVSATPNEATLYAKSSPKKWRLTAKYIPLGVFRYEGLQIDQE